jgi:hypothetical protein
MARSAFPFMHRPAALLPIQIRQRQRRQIGAMAGEKALLPIGAGATALRPCRNNIQILCHIGRVQLQMPVARAGPAATIPPAAVAAATGAGRSTRPLRPASRPAPPRRKFARHLGEIQRCADRWSGPRQGMHQTVIQVALAMVSGDAGAGRHHPMFDAQMRRTVGFEA